MTDRPASTEETTRKISKELFDISKNLVFIGGVKFLADKSGSNLLSFFYFLLSGLLLAHINSYFQVSVFSEKIREKYRINKTLALSGSIFVSFLALFAIILSTDQAIKSIVAAQEK